MRTLSEHPVASHGLPQRKLSRRSTRRAQSTKTKEREREQGPFGIDGIVCSIHVRLGRLYPEIERCRIAIHLSIPMHRFIDAPIHRTDSNASFITDASGLNRCIGTELMNLFKIITDYYRCIGKNYQCIGNLAMHRI